MSASATVLPETATHQQTRTFNEQLVLRALRDHSPLPRTDLAHLTGLTRTSVGDLVGTLIDDGLIGLNLGEAQLRTAVVTLRGEILRSDHLPLEGRSGDATVELLSPTEAPLARGAVAIARYCIGSPEREGVGER